MKNEKVNATSYEFWVSTKELFWTPNSPDKPSKELFDKDYEPTFQKLDKCYVTFVSRFTMRTVLPKFINSQQPTIFKIVDKETGEKRYFLLNKTIKEASGMFEYEGTLDAWLTYGHPFIEWAKTSSIPIKVNRFLNNRLMRQYLYEHHYEKADPLFDFSKESYALALSYNPTIGSGEKCTLTQYNNRVGDDVWGQTDYKDYYNVTNILINNTNTNSIEWKVFVTETDGGSKYNFETSEIQMFIAPDTDQSIQLDFFANLQNESTTTRRTINIDPARKLEQWFQRVPVGAKLRGIYNFSGWKSLKPNWIKGIVVYNYKADSANPQGGSGTCLAIRTKTTESVTLGNNNANNQNLSFYPTGYAFQYPLGVRPIKSWWTVEFDRNNGKIIINHDEPDVGSTATQNRSMFTIPFSSRFKQYALINNSPYYNSPSPLHPYLLSRISYKGIYLTPEARLRYYYPSGSTIPAGGGWNKRPDGIWLNGMLEFDGSNFNISNRGMFSQAIMYQSNGTMLAPISKYNEFITSSKSSMNAQLQIAKENSDLQKTKAISESVTSTADNIAKGIGNVLSFNWTGLASSVAKTASSISNGVTGVMEAENIYKHKELQIEAEKADVARSAKPTNIVSNYALDDFEQKYKKYLHDNLPFSACKLKPVVDYGSFYQKDYNLLRMTTGGDTQKQYEDSLLVKAPLDQINSRITMDRFWKVGVYGDFYSACSWVFGNDDNTPYGYEYYRMKSGTSVHHLLQFKNYFTFLNLEIDENVYRQFKKRTTVEEIVSIKTIFESGVRIWYDVPTFHDRTQDEYDASSKMRYILIPYNAGLEDMVIDGRPSDTYFPYRDTFYGDVASFRTGGRKECSSVENDLTKNTKNTKKRSSK